MQLKIEQLYKKYDGKDVLKDVQLEVPQARVIALIGSSGSGKSTLLRLMAGLESYESGRIELNHKELGNIDDVAYRKRIGFVFQDHNLFSHLSVLENIYLVLEKVHKKSRLEMKDKVEALLEQFGLLDHAHKKPHQLSGGQAQRASIVRALAIEPELILLDEPTSALDPVLTYEVLTAIRKLVENQVDFVIVTHEIGFAKRLADLTLFMEDGEIVEMGGSEMFENPQTESLKRFLSMEIR